ncbi:P-loop containing nucleoside triphosphate hydrolase protein [Gonapodya prolifera JEL478]|uniref:p-loop containing nucleoside triphosphate hydrolase protein n=1 Tax=Gonapodya prolifera (strain JEL478) TaxID=1344416 RepID=A0A139AJ31_GONPJ|nr:P-loop containing nucleoside triphosphate hydrolase protein [Gonapodya prolifera JEL478]|eukprot:KXS16473.1 P-loop containing nucleoside triphosphate hydrolase protein [Gonapodya prolifera JEL478]
MVPKVFLVTVGLWTLVQLRGRHESLKSPLYWQKSCVLVCLALVALADLVRQLLVAVPPPPYAFLASSTTLVAFLVALLVNHNEHLRNPSTSAVLLLSYLFFLLASAIKLRSVIILEEYHTDPLRFSLFVSEMGLTLVAFCLENLSKTSHWYISLDTEPNASLEETASVWSVLTFHWMSPLMALGYRKVLSPGDLPNLRPIDRASNISDAFQQAWDDEKRKSSPSFVRACSSAFGGPFWSAAFFKLCQDIMQFVQPMLLRHLMDFARSHMPDVPGSKPQAPFRGFVIAGAMFLSAITQSFLLHRYFHLVIQTGIRLKVATATAVYRKSLAVSNAAMQTGSQSVGNLMSIDAAKIGELTTYLHILWSGPFQIFLALWMLYGTLGPSVFAGLAIMILMIPINTYLTKLSRGIQKRQMANKDSRFKLVDEFLSGIKVIKLYAWERPFLQSISDVRQKELDTLKSYAYLSALQSFTWSCAPFLVSFATFALYSVTSSEPLTSTRIFVSLSLFNLLRFPLSMFPSVVASITEASVSVDRVRNYLLEEEKDTSAILREPMPPPKQGQAGERVIVQNAWFRWTKGDTVDDAGILKNINLTVREGELVALVGSVGSGKSSLINALLGEMYKVDGIVRMRGKVAFAAQTAWIMNATLRDNVLFGRPYDELWYNKVVEACALKADLEVLPAGDMTEIGERGINLSGGQKQRVSLARAVYSRSDIYLLDDPLSAVDAHVGRWIFNHVFGKDGILKNRARILVTHAIHFLKQCDQVLLLDGGKIAESGSYPELMSKKGMLYRLIEEYDVAHVGEDEDESEAEPKTTSVDSHLQNGQQGSTKSLENGSATNGSADKSKDVGLLQPTNRLTTQEDRAEGAVSWKVYANYALACGAWSTLLYILMIASSQSVSVIQNLWLADWSRENDVSAEDVPAKNVSLNWRLGIYGTLGLLFAVLTVSQTLVAWVLCGIRSGRTLHAGMLNRVGFCPQSFFDTTPLGRILNRFSRDQSVIDEVLPRSFMSFFQTLSLVIASLVVNSVTNPAFIAFIAPLSVVYLWVSRYYLFTSRELKRLEATSRSPIYAHFQETLGGVQTIRAYRDEARFIAENTLRIDTNQKANYPSNASNRWLAMRLELVGSFIILASSLFSVVTIVTVGGLAASIVGLAVTYALNITQTLNWMVRQSCEIETNIVSVERVKEYSELPLEAPYEISENKPDDTWPSRGVIELNHYATRYRAGLDLVLSEINFCIAPAQKIGLVGRTGSGKSSLALALFRVIEPAAGRILIDGVDISQIGLFDLRSRLTVIPQDPVLFQGTVRRNLDPMGQASDSQIWNALRCARLAETVGRLDGGLEANVIRGGENFSVGQRQLICLARALLRHTKVLILDEATASVDVETDQVIQETIRTEFKDCTILTIAHRINTILDYDRIVVLAQGKVLEMDSPTKLLADSTSAFHALAKEAGLVRTGTPKVGTSSGLR